MKQFSEEMATMFEWYNEFGHTAVIKDAALPKFTCLDAWLRASGWQDRTLEAKGVDWDRDKDDHSTTQKAPTSMPCDTSFGKGQLLDKFCAINYIAAEPHYQARFEDLFMNRAHAVDGLQGFLGMQVLRPREKDGEYLVVSWWDAAEDFNAWRTNPAFLKGHRGFADLKEARKKKERPPMASRFNTYDIFSE